MRIKPCFPDKNESGILSRRDKEAVLPIKNNIKSFHKFLLDYWNQSWLKQERIKWPVELRIDIDGLGFAYWENCNDNYHLLKECFQKLHNSCNIKRLILDLHCGELELNKDFYQILKQLRRLPRLKELTLNFQYSKMNEKTLRIFQLVCQQLRYLRQLSYLKIITCMPITNDCFLAIIDGIHSLRSPSSFSCRIKVQHNEIAPSTIERFLMGLSRFDQLSHLNLNFDLYTYLYEPIQINKAFWNHLTLCKNLTSLQINMFNHISVSKEDIEAFFQSLKTLHKLRILVLDFASYPEEMSLETGVALLNGFKSLGKSRYLPGLNLSELCVLFPDIEEFTEESVNGFAQCLISMRDSLKYLTLDFKNVKRLTDEEMLEFLKHLSSLENLKSLDLRFFSKPVTDYFLQNLSFRWTFLPNLSTLKLYFNKTNQVTSRGLKALQTNLAWTEALSRLDLFFGLLPNVNEYSIQAFCYGLEDLYNLTHLKLDLSEYSQVTDQTMIALASGLGSLNQLESLDLDLTYCRKLTNQGMDTLSSGLKSLKQLRSFALDVLYCPRVNELCLEYWADRLPDLPKLKKTLIHVFCCKNRPDETLIKIRENKIKGVVYCGPDFTPWMDHSELTGCCYWITNPGKKC